MTQSHDPFKDGGFTREAVLEAIRLGEGRFTKREIARSLSLRGDAKVALKSALKILENDGEITRTGQKSYTIRGGLPAVTVVEVVDRDVDGEMICRAVSVDGDSPVIRLAPGQGKGGKRESALGIGDKFLARLEKDGDEYYASVMRTLGKSAHRILCVYRDSGRGGARLVPVDRRTKHELIPAKGEGTGAKRRRSGDGAAGVRARPRPENRRH